jgi:hypothetical protein
MYFTATELRESTKALHEASRTLDCAVPRTDKDGKTERSKSEGKPPVPYGTHGAAFIEIDPETKNVRCGACAGTQDATVNDAQFERVVRRKKP